MAEKSASEWKAEVQALEERLHDAEHMIDAIRTGEVDAFAINKDDTSVVYTLESNDYAYRHLIEEFCEGAVNLTEEGLIVYTNKYFAELLKIPYEKLIGTEFEDYLDPGSKAAFAKLFHEALSGKSKGEINLRLEKRIIPVYISLTTLKPVMDLVGMVLTDLTDQKKQESLVLEYQKSLEKKNLELIQSNADLASFAYIASHDLQEPLRKIQTFATRIMEKESENLSEMGRDHFGRMQHAAERMQALIEDLLMYSRTNTAERKFEDADLGLIVDEIKTELKEDLEEKHATIDATNMCHAYVIPFQFRQMLYNLISNSLKFSRADKAPYIKIRSEIVNGSKLKNDKLKADKKYCHISVADNGIGFEQTYSEKIFELFQRLHGKLAYVGTGIGLAIVKKIVDNHFGVITATSEVNQGATFDIYLPMP